MVGQQVAFLDAALLLLGRNFHVILGYLPEDEEVR
jgi:hypothetical protein